MNFAKHAAIVVILLILSSTTAVNAGSRNRGYVYDGAALGDSRAIVINVATKFVSVQSKSRANLDDTSSDVAGEFRDCGNRDYYCMTGPLNVAIPKTDVASKWEFAGIFCKSSLERHGDAYQITCISKAQRIQTVLVYSYLHGILSFKNTPIGGSALFKLRGNRGLFQGGFKVHAQRNQ